eukprot:gene8353-17211_t
MHFLNHKLRVLSLFICCFIASLSFKHIPISNIKIGGLHASVMPDKVESSAAEAISTAKSAFQILQAAEKLIFPGEETLHFQTQEHHQKKRQSAGTNALKRLTKMLSGISTTSERQNISANPLFERLLYCAFAPISSSMDSKTVPKQTLLMYMDALRTLGPLSPIPNHLKSNIVRPFLETIQPLIVSESGSIPPSYISGCEWACRRLDLDPADYKQISLIYKSLQLPFHLECNLVSNLITINDMKNEVPFQVENLITRDGKKVQERRETCWMAESGVGGLAYSGKIMVPVPFSPSVTRVRDAIEEATGIRYDCCLINWYGDGESACKFHSDPDMGRLWARDSHVVSIGETRRFNLRSIPQKNFHSTSSNQSQIEVEDEVENESFQHSFHVFHGDCFHMFNNCQEAFQHCVMKSEGSSNNSPRSSIVFKKSLPGLGGRRGHGIKSQSTATTTTSSSSTTTPIKTKSELISPSTKTKKNDLPVKSASTSVKSVGKILAKNGNYKGNKDRSTSSSSSSTSNKSSAGKK